MVRRPLAVPVLGALDALSGLLGLLLGTATLAASGIAFAGDDSGTGGLAFVVALAVLAKNGLLVTSGLGLLFDRAWGRTLVLVYAWWGLVEVAFVLLGAGLLIGVAVFQASPDLETTADRWPVALLVFLLPCLGAVFPGLQLFVANLRSVKSHFGVGADPTREVGSLAPSPPESSMTATPRILAFAGSARQASFNKKLVRVAAEGARAAGAEVTIVDLRDLPMPLYDGDLEEREGIPENALELMRLLREHDGLLLACPEYNSSITPLLKNAIDWASRAAEGEQPLACFKGKVAGLVAASPGGFGGLRGLVTVRSILGNIGVLVVPEQVAVSKAHEAFDGDGNLANERQLAAVENVGRRVAEMAGRLV